MVSKQVVELVKALQSQGFENKLSWKETDTENVFETTVGSATLRIREDADPFSDRAPDYFLEIVRDDRVLERVSDGELSSYLHDSYQTMSEIYSSARAKARGIADIVDDVLRHLGVEVQPKQDQRQLDDTIGEDEIPF